jgi:hypothetical protein
LTGTRRTRNHASSRRPSPRMTDDRRRSLSSRVIFREYIFSSARLSIKVRVSIRRCVNLEAYAEGKSEMETRKCARKGYRRKGLSVAACIKSLFLTLKTLYNEFEILVKYSQSNIIMLISLFLIILSNNFFSLFPYVFTSSRHILSFPFPFNMNCYNNL